MLNYHKINISWKVKFTCNLGKYYRSHYHSNALPNTFQYSPQPLDHLINAQKCIFTMQKQRESLSTFPLQFAFIYFNPSLTDHWLIVRERYMYISHERLHVSAIGLYIARSHALYHFLYQSSTLNYLPNRFQLDSLTLSLRKPLIPFCTEWPF